VLKYAKLGCIFLFDVDFAIQVSKTVPESTVAVTLSADERVDFNISTTFVELALNMLSAFNTQGDAILSEARGSNAPYRVRNNTGSSIRIWSDTQWNDKVNDQNAMLLENGKSIDWRFEDWKTMREVCPYLCDTLIFEVPTIL
jgi:vacuolar protein sorting-associated protein 13A/C